MESSDTQVSLEGWTMDNLAQGPGMYSVLLTQPLLAQGAGRLTWALQDRKELDFETKCFKSRTVLAFCCCNKLTVRLSLRQWRHACLQSQGSAVRMGLSALRSRNGQQCACRRLTGKSWQGSTHRHDFWEILGFLMSFLCQIMGFHKWIGLLSPLPYFFCICIYVCGVYVDCTCLCVYMHKEKKDWLMWGVFTLYIKAGYFAKLKFPCQLVLRSEFALGIPWLHALQHLVDCHETFPSTLSYSVVYYRPEWSHIDTCFCFPENMELVDPHCLEVEFPLFFTSQEGALLF